MKTVKRFGNLMNVAAMTSLLMTSACAWVDVPDSRNVKIPSPTMADQRKTAINERPDSVMYLPLGEDVLVPEMVEDTDFPHEFVGPFELRGETLAGALQLILADYDISLAFETDEGLTRRVTVANLRGDLGKVVNQVCSLANLYCAFENGTVIVKNTQTFTVTLPPLGTSEETTFLDNVAQGLAAIVGSEVAQPIVDPTTRTLIYSATQRTADIAARYFQRLRANTAMIVFETYIWEVALNSGNSTGIQWDKIATFGKFDASIDINGAVGADFLRPISIGLPTAHELTGAPTNLVELLSQFGAVKTISQPQITVLSGSKAELRVADTRNYVSEIATTLDNGQSTTSVNTDSVDTGFTLTIGSSWDKSTVYANVNIELTDVKQIDDFSFSDGGANGATTTVQLPQTSERQLTTQIRVRPGDSVLIAGLVRENDNFDSRGIGFMQPVLPDSRTAQAKNLELVILLRPRVVIYTATNDKRYIDYALKKHKLPGTGVEVTSPKELGEEPSREPSAPEPLGAVAPANAPQAIVPSVSRPRVVPSVPDASPLPAPVLAPPPEKPVSSAAPVAVEPKGIVAAPVSGAPAAFLASPAPAKPVASSSGAASKTVTPVPVSNAAPDDASLKSAPVVAPAKTEKTQDSEPVLLFEDGKGTSPTDKISIF